MKHKTLPPHTVDSMIATITRHVPKEGCMDVNGNCTNLNESGGRCAMAAFLPDDSPLLVPDRASMPIDLRDADLAAMPLGLAGLEALQAIHDREVLEQIRIQFADRAEEPSNLNVPQTLIDWIKTNVENGEHAA